MSCVHITTGNAFLDRRVKIVHSTRAFGVSEGRWSSLNLGDHVEDNAQHVEANRQIFSTHLPNPAHWLRQVHGVYAQDLDVIDLPSLPIADAAFSRQNNRVVCIQTADCLPVVLVNAAATAVGAAHAGWRGLCNGVLENLASAMGDVRGGFAWLGPAIGPTAFEVGPEVLQAFLDEARPAQREQTRSAFLDLPSLTGKSAPKYLADLYALARLRLSNLGIEFIMGGDRCTFREREDFFSYRRDGETGRMASCVWLQNEG